MSSFVPTHLVAHRAVVLKSWIVAVGLFVADLLIQVAFAVPDWWDWTGPVIGLALWVAVIATASYFWRRWQYRRQN